MSDFILNKLNKIIQLWSDLLFQDKNTVPLEVMRLGIGFLLFFNYGMLAPQDVIAMYGNSGLVSPDVEPQATSFLTFSLLVFFDEPWQLLTFHYSFVLLCLMFCAGWQTSWIKWLVLIGQLSYLNRNGFAFYGVDTVAVALLFLLCMAPIGNALSLDRVRKVRKHKQNLGLDSRPPVFTSRRGFAIQRLMQFQMAVIFFSAGIEKLYGDTWWYGTAPWIAMANNETAFFPLWIFAEQFWIINLIAYGTILIELAYPFLIWGRKTRPYLLVAALSLHLGIAIFLGMYYFATLMAFGHLVFVRREWYSQAGVWWRKRFGNMEMIYDGDCGFCKRSMALFLAFDGLSQIKTRNYHVNPSLVVSNEEADKALYTVTANNEAIPGFDAYRYVVVRVPGMWWFMPLYYIPVLSRLIGRPIYNYIAAHRMQVSKMMFRAKNEEPACKVDSA